MNRLLNCPFCGSDNIKSSDDGRPMIFCWGCGATMAWPDMERTIKAWNTRLGGKN
uniref:Putative restriction alleviation protein n=1 Tax=viral metagenome TaxID=1070528 RepID=A0A6H1Z5R7_9ZZZZ